MPTRSLNLGILARVDAGKTTFTEPLLHLDVLARGSVTDPGSFRGG